MIVSPEERIRADFNGLFGEILCLSHEEIAINAVGRRVELQEGMVITVFDEDCDENGNLDDLIASEVVERPPDWLQCRGSKWVLRIDENGVQSESDLSKNQTKDTML
jgi:hypothetical protein